MTKNNYTWKDIIKVNEKIYAEEFPISGETDNDGNSYQIDDFLSSVAEKHGVTVDDIETYMMDAIKFDPKEVPYGAESCGCYINGTAEWLIRNHPSTDCVLGPEEM